MDKTLIENVEIARVLKEYADLPDIQGGNRFRIGSYRRAAGTIQSHLRPMLVRTETPAQAR